MGDVVRAAGGVVRRGRGDGPFEYVVVHRPKYDDWSLPKGKLDEGEGWEEAARREVEEETGLRCRLLEPAGETRYTDSKGRPKVVRYWLMEPVGGSFSPTEEVDELHWLSLDDALGMLSYDHDRDLLRAAAGA
jgi:8-oxo-dGTP diphosphatase